MEVGGVCVWRGGGFPSARPAAVQCVQSAEQSASLHRPLLPLTAGINVSSLRLNRPAAPSMKLGSSP